LAIAVVVATGCGGDDGNAFRAKADAVCSERHRAVVQAYDTAMKKGTTGPALAEAALSTQIDAESGLLRDLRELDPPKNLERTYSEFLTAHTHRRDLLEAAQHALQRHPLTRLLSRKFGCP